MKVVSVVIKERSFAKDHFKKWIEKAKQYKIDIAPWIPKRVKYDIDIELHNTNPGFANMLRAVILCGVPAWRLQLISLNRELPLADPDTYECDINTNIQSIPINQTLLNKHEEKRQTSVDFKGTLVKFAKDGSYDDVTTADLKCSLMGKPIELCEDIISIHKLGLGRAVSIELAVKKNNGFANACFSNVENIRYEDLEEKKGEHSLTRLSSKWRIGCTTHRGFSHKHEFIHLLFDYLNGIWNDVEFHVKQMQGDIYNVQNNSFTIANLSIFQFNHPRYVAMAISHEIYSFMPEIKYVAVTNIPTSLAKLKISHSDPIAIILRAIENIQKNIGVLKDAMLKA